MRRREFIAGLGSAAALPLTAHAQQTDRMRRVGVLAAYAEADPEGQARIRASFRGLTDLGWVEGRNVRFDVRWAGADVLQQRRYARELVALAPDVILVNGTTATQALRDATQTIPIVFVNIFDPVATGVVSNLARPEANLTGFTAFEGALGGKWLSLIKVIVPQLAHVAALFNPDTAPFAPFYLQAAQYATDRVSVKFAAAGVRSGAEIETAIAVLASGDAGGLMVLPDIFNVANSATIIELAARYRVPTIYYDRFFVADGGLISYGPIERLQYDYGATYVDRILRGSRPSDLPVQFVTKFESVINLKTAKVLGVSIPETLLATADAVIE
jgi:putative tryptophan/tyrosine transport system substrate-binding protein